MATGSPPSPLPLPDGGAALHPAPNGAFEVGLPGGVDAATGRVLSAADLAVAGALELRAPSGTVRVETA